MHLRKVEYNLYENDNVILQDIANDYSRPLVSRTDEQSRRNIRG